MFLIFSNAIKVSRSPAVSENHIFTIPGYQLLVLRYKDKTWQIIRKSERTNLFRYRYQQIVKWNKMFNKMCIFTHNPLSNLPSRAFQASMGHVQSKRRRERRRGRGKRGHLSDMMACVGKSDNIHQVADHRYGLMQDFVVSPVLRKGDT